MLIPIPVEEAAKEAKLTQYESGMGMPVGFFPCPAGVTVTEIRAIEFLIRFPYSLLVLHGRSIVFSKIHFPVTGFL
jgi:hypothetical protein